MQRFQDKKKVISLTLVGLAYLLIVTPLVISNLQKQQELRSRADVITVSQTNSLNPAQQSGNAPVSAKAVCGNAPSDIMLIIDRSGSMNDKIGSTSTKIQDAKTAAKNFVNIISQNTGSNVGLVSFSTAATLNSKLTNNYNSVNSQISALSASGSTCTECAVDKANQEIASDGRKNIKKVVILLTDGLANFVEGGSSQTSQSVAEQAATNAVKAGNATSGTIFFTIGLGKDVNATFLKQIATTTGGTYYFSPTSTQLNQIYQQISQIIGKGSISGFIFNDGNANGVYDPSEQKQSGWTIQNTSAAGKQTAVSASDGSYSFTGLCDGTYAVSEMPQSNWTQTLPSNNASYTVTIKNANQSAVNNFGNTNKRTTMNMTVSLDGIGNRGDNTNPTASSLSNKNPLHKTIAADIEIYTLSSYLIASGPGTLTYNATLGAYTGDVPISNGFPTGQYIIKVKTPSHLRRQLDQIQTITSGMDNTISPASLVAGDINNDNTLNILDYNLLLNCYSDLTPPVSCPTADAKTSADLNDDGAVNQFDYNLFLREITTQPGQ